MNVFRWLSGVKLVACLASSFSMLTATSLFVEDFQSYSPGELNNGAGGSGFTSNWTAAATPTEVIDPGTGLSYTVSGGGTVSGGNRALRYTGNGDNAAYRTISSFGGPSLFFSFLFRFSAGSIQSNDFLTFWFDNVANTTHTTVPNLGFKANRGTGAGDEDFFARLQLGNEVYSTPVSVGLDYFVVGRLWKSSGTSAGNFDRFWLWVNPAAGDEASPDGTTTIGGSITQFNILGMRAANLDAGDVLLADSLNAGTTWRDVVPLAIPEPGTVWAFGAGLSALGFLRRRT